MSENGLFIANENEGGEGSSGSRPERNNLQDKEELV
jgi:hypothetical protein